MNSQLILSPVLLDNLRHMIEEVVVNSNKKQLRGDERKWLIDAYSDAIALSHLRKEEFRQPGSFWAEINTPIVVKFGKRTLFRVKEAAWKLFEERSQRDWYGDASP